MDWFRNWAKVGEEVRRTKKKEKNRKTESGPRERAPRVVGSATGCPRGGLFAQAQTSNDGEVTTAFGVAQVIEQTGTLADHHQQTSSTGMIFHVAARCSVSSVMRAVSKAI